MALSLRRSFLLTFTAVAGLSASGALAANVPVDATATKKKTLVKTKQASPKSETIMVTGSYLRSSNNSSANPVQVITAKQIQQTSATSLGDYLQRLPSVGSSGTPNQQTNGGGGVSCTDIRNFGSKRVLILIDGKRTAINAATSCVDLNTIPIEEIASVEMLKDGGSELYGADAVSGVINIKLRHDVTKATITMRGGISQYGDAKTGLLSAMKGFNFDHGRGNVTLFGQYNTSGGIMSQDRAWAANPQQSNPVTGTPLYGSSIVPSGRVTNPITGTNLVSNGDGTFHRYSNADRYNFAKDTMVQNYNQNSALSGDAHYDVDSHFKPYANVRYSHTTTARQMAASPVSGGIKPSPLLSSWTIPAGSPYNIWGKDAVMSRRMNDFGPRKMDYATDTWTVIGGAKGKIWRGWEYDASMTYGQSRWTANTQNMGNYRHLLQMTGVRQLDPTNPGSKIVYDPTVCTSQPGCVLSNPLAPLSPEAAAYGKFTQHDHAEYQLRDFNLRINNSELVKMPYEHGGNVGVAFGMEHRSEQLSSKPDPIVVSGDSTGNASSYSGGGFNVNEVYAEGQIPLLQNAFLAKDLTIDGQGRWSDYNTFGSTKNWKVSINWAPVRDIRFRATLGTSYRQPNVYELYGGQSLGYPSAYDPCSAVSSYGAQAAAVQARCAGEGINTATFVPQNTGQVPTISGGNAKLQPESGRTYTIGTVVTPRWVPGLSASVTYWHYSLNNTISTLGTQYILDQCYTGADTSNCGAIAARSTSQQLTSVNAFYQNLGGIRTSGIDFDLDYHVRLTPHDSLNLSNNMQQLVSYLQQNVPNGQWYNYTGRLFYAGGSGQPRVSDYAQATWQHDDFSFTYMMRYIGGMVWNNGVTDLTAKTAGQYKTPGIFTHDITLGYRLNRWNFEAGVSNLFDKKPPFVMDAATNTNIYQYGSLIVGRYAFLQAGISF